MFPFLTFLLFFMAVSLFNSGRSRKGKATAEAPWLLDQHLPKSAQVLISPLSDDDREVLTYMLAFGLHLQMLAGVVFPACKLQWKPWKDPSAKVGLKREHAFSSNSFSAKSRSGQKKASSLFPHKPSCSCDCFSCYSSFWSRWAASPNRDLLNKIIEIAEMPEGREEQKASRGKEKKKKRVLEKEAGGKKSKGEKWKLQSVQTTLKPSASFPASAKMDEAMLAAHNMDGASLCTSMDVMYAALWDNVSKDDARVLAAHIMDHDSLMLTEVNERLSMGAGMKEVLPHLDAWSDVSTIRNKTSRDASTSRESSCRSSPIHGKAPAMMGDEADERFASQSSSAGGPTVASTQCKNNLKFQRTGKCKKSKVAPMEFEDSFVKVVDQESDVLNEIGEGSMSPRLGDARLSSRGFFSRVFPDTLCDIASRLWDLVSTGSRSHTMDYY